MGLGDLKNTFNQERVKILLIRKGAICPPIRIIKILIRPSQVRRSDSGDIEKISAEQETRHTPLSERLEQTKIQLIQIKIGFSESEKASVDFLGSKKLKSSFFPVS